MMLGASGSPSVTVKLVNGAFHITSNGLDHIQLFAIAALLQRQANQMLDEMALQQMMVQQGMANEKELRKT